MNIELNFILNVLQNNIAYSYSNPTAQPSGTFSYTNNDVINTIVVKSINYEKARLIQEISEMKSEDDILEIKTFLINQY